MRDALQRWSENAVVGKALIAAGVVFLLVQLLPRHVIDWLRHLWPLLVIGAGFLLLWRRR